MSAGLMEQMWLPGEKGYNLAGLLLLGKDETIVNVCPAYERMLLYAE